MCLFCASNVLRVTPPFKTGKTGGCPSGVLLAPRHKGTLQKHTRPHAKWGDLTSSAAHVKETFPPGAPFVT